MHYKVLNDFQMKGDWKNINETVSAPDDLSETEARKLISRGFLAPTTAPADAETPDPEVAEEASEPEAAADAEKPAKKKAAKRKKADE